MGKEITEPQQQGGIPKARANTTAAIATIGSTIG